MIIKEPLGYSLTKTKTHYIPGKAADDVTVFFEDKQQDWKFQPGDIVFVYTAREPISSIYSPSQQDFFSAIVTSQWYFTASESFGYKILGLKKRNFGYVGVVNKILYSADEFLKLGITQQKK